MSAKAVAPEVTEAEAEAALATIEPPANRQLLDAARAEGQPLIERLENVVAALANLEAAQARPTEGGASLLLDAEIEARKASAAKRRDLEVEQEVVLERLKPIQAEVDRLTKLVADEELAAKRAATIAAGMAALERVAKAREALNAEIVALGEVARSTPVRWGMVTELHFAVRKMSEDLIASNALLFNEVG